MEIAALECRWRMRCGKIGIVELLGLKGRREKRGGIGSRQGTTKLLLATNNFESPVLRSSGSAVITRTMGHAGGEVIIPRQ